MKKLDYLQKYLDKPSKKKKREKKESEPESPIRDPVNLEKPDENCEKDQVSIENEKPDEHDDISEP